MKKMLVLAAMAVSGAFACGSTGGNDAGLDFSTGTKILNHLEGKTMVMQGADIPGYPLGFNANINYGASTQCYNQVSIAVGSGNFGVTTKLGSFAPGGDGGLYQVGVCNTATAAGSPLSYTSSAVLFQNVANNGECFDVDLTYTGFSQEGRGSIAADGHTVVMELYASGRATNIRCVNGNPGTIGADGGVKVLGATLAGDSRQTYRVLQ
jgi:hypothetical protein